MSPGIKALADLIELAASGAEHRAFKKCKLKNQRLFDRDDEWRKAHRLAVLSEALSAVIAAESAEGKC